MLEHTILFDLLACPVCKGKLHYNRSKEELVCHFDRLAYPIRENIPVILVDEARRLPLEEMEKRRK